MVCPICKKEFEKTDEHCYLIDNQYTCSWKCFFNQVNKWEKERIASQGEVKPGRKRKIYEWSL